MTADLRKRSAVMDRRYNWIASYHYFPVMTEVAMNATQHSIGRRAQLLVIIILIAFQAGTAMAAQIFGVDAANNLVRFNSAAPGTVLATQPISGFASGETVLGLDFRPKDGTLFALGSTGRLYIIDYTSSPTTATATPLGVAGAFTLNGTAFGFDFNPTVDRIRVVSNTDQDLRLNPNDGTLAATDTALAYAVGDPNAGANPNVVGSAYTNNVSGATSTTLYGIDSNLDILVTQGGVNGASPSANTGQLFTVGPLGVDVGDNVAFDVDGTSTTTGFVAATVTALERLYTINLGTGAMTLVGTMGTGTPLQAIAVAPTAFTATLVGTTATFNGSSAADTIVFDQSGGLLRHNRFSKGDSGFNSDFDFDSTVPGDQTLSATNPAVTVIVNAGGSDDTIIVGTNAAPASGLAATFNLNGQGGGDTLTINDTTDATGRTISADGEPFSSTIVFLAGPALTTSGVEGITLNAGTGDDTITLLGSGGATTNINTGPGADTVEFRNGSALAGGFIDGGTGTDTLDYSNYTTPIVVDLSPGSVQTLFLGLMTGAQESGPLSNSPAVGQFVGLLNPAQSAFTFKVSYSGITGAPISGAHFHNQSAGVAGPIVRGLLDSEKNGFATPAGTFAGVWSNSDPTLDPPASDAPIRPLNAPSPVTPGSTLVQELIAGRIYFDIHTLPNFPSGEIRGQILSQGLVSPATGTGGVRNVENIFGGSADDTLIGDANVNVLSGVGGNDLLVGGPGNDQLFGDAGDDTIVWNNGDGSDFMEGGGGNDLVRVNGSPTGDDQFLLQVNPANPTRLRFDRTNLGLFNLNIGTTEALEFNTLGGNDTTTIDFANGNPIPVNGLKNDGGTGNDRLVLQRSSGSYVATSMIHTATGNGSGLITATGGGTINYTGLEPIDDTVPTTNYTFTAPVASNQIQLVNGPTVSGFATVTINDGGTAQFELTNIARKTNVTVNSGLPAQLVVLNYSAAPTGLTNLNVNTNDDDDEIDVLALASGTAARVDTRSSGDYVRVVGAGIASGASLQLDGNNGFDHLVYDTGGVAVSTSAGPGPGQTTVTRAGSGNVVYQNFEDVFFNTGAALPAQALNISTRLRVETGENVLIGGFIISGTQTKRVIFRARGPSLAASGVTTPLLDPTLELYGPDGALIAMNDNWKDSQEAEISGTGFAPTVDSESAIVATLQPNGYTVIVKGKGGTTGTGIVEGYDLNPAAASKFGNLSTRGFVQTGDNVMIGGFILGNNGGSTRIALRGLGPSLTQVGVTNVLADPTLSLYDSNGTRLVFNDNWQDNPAQAVQLSSNGLAPSRPQESGIFVTLTPGAYTAILAGANNTSGVGLVELYDLQ